MLYVGNLNLRDATNMETTEQRFTQIRAGRKKKTSKKPARKSRSNGKGVYLGNGNERQEPTEQISKGAQGDTAKK